MEEGPRNEQANPDNEAEETYHVHQSQAANAFFHKLAEIGHPKTIYFYSRSMRCVTNFKTPIQCSKTYAEMSCKKLFSFCGVAKLLYHLCKILLLRTVR